MNTHQQLVNNLNSELKQMIDEYHKEIKRLNGNSNHTLIKHFENSEPSKYRNSAFRHMLNEIKIL